MVINMVQLKYQIEDKVIAQVLGIQNFTNDESAVLELVKNAYDAQATFCDIVFKDGILTITDDGCGMNEDSIIQNWMFIGKSEKGYCIQDGDEIRVLAGSKGIGRFALARLGEYVQLISKKKEFPAVRWVTDWNSSHIEKAEISFEHGTQIRIEKLREKWSSQKIENLKLFLAKTYNDDLMTIKVTAYGSTETLQKYFSNALLGVNCYATIDLCYNSVDTSLTTEIKSVEFSDRAKCYCPNVDDIGYQRSTIDLTTELYEPKGELTKCELKTLLQAIGDFKADLLFYVTHTKEDIDRFLYNNIRLSQKPPAGIVLYRNAFSISSMEGKKDWLGLGVRSRKSPAAASHPTGSWRVRENQISGKVLIDRKKNVVLEDLSNRQGLNENIYYEYFIQIIQRGLAEFEAFRQRIVRGVNQKNKPVEKSEKEMISLVVNKPRGILALKKHQYLELATEISTLVKENKSLFNEREEINERYHYEVRLLNVLATMGLKASSVAHELQNDRNSVVANPKFIKEALINYGMWDRLCSKECTQYIFQNVPEMLKNTERIHHKISIFMGAMLANTSKSRFKKNQLEIFQVLDNIRQGWCCDYAQIQIDLKIEKGVTYSTSEDVIYVIFDNLILNTVQQNNERNKINIEIFMEQRESQLFFRYSDNGVGLAERYRSNPFRILEVHETTREDGHGLGMWIVNNTCLSSGGRVEKISGEDGFCIEFTIGNKLV